MLFQKLFAGVLKFDYRTEAFNFSLAGYHYVGESEK